MRILLAIDGSKFSEAAVRTVMEQARSKRTEIRVLYVVEPPSLLVLREMGGYDAHLEEVWDEETKQGEALVAKVAKLLRSKGMKATAAVEQGDPKSKILDTASKWRAKLIVLGSHGRRGLEHFLLGSVSEAVWGYALAWFLVNDRVKLAAYKVFDPRDEGLIGAFWNKGKFLVAK
jgi:nucleotide-binding universal stress UspA family protein